jgi:hypothetical protein
MIIINLQNVEDLILNDNKLYIKLVELRHIFDQWRFNVRFPFLRSQKKQCCIDLLKQFTGEHISSLEEHFKDTIIINGIDNSLVKNKTLDLNLDLKELTDFNNFGYLTLSRDADKLYMTSWR